MSKLTATDTAYQKILRNLKCSFCPTCGDQAVSWHHLKCLGVLRSASWSTIPVCNKCHNERGGQKHHCHNYGITREEQENALFDTWCLVMNQNIHEFKIAEVMSAFIDIDALDVGDHEKWKRKGELYWQALIDEGVI